MMVVNLGIVFVFIIIIIFHVVCFLVFVFCLFFGEFLNVYMC